MPDAVRGYPKWEGELTPTPTFLVIARREARRALENQWTRAALVLALAYAVLVVGSLYSLRDRVGIHTMEAYTSFLELVAWAGLAIGAIAAGPALLEDARRDALELYYARAVRKWDYLGGKSLAVTGLAFAAVAGAGLIYWAGAWLTLDTHPANWGWVWAGTLGYAALWALVVAGLGLGLSCVSRSSRAATLILLGGVAILDVLFGRLLEVITRDERILVLSPLADLGQQTAWLFPGVEAPYTFPWWWGLIVLGALLVMGWGTVVWRHPRLRGVE